MPTVRQALNEALAEALQQDDRILILGEEVAEYNGAYKVTQGLFDKFGPKRVIDTPITEHGFAGVGVGLAFSGLKPIIEFMTFNFAMQAMDHIINSAAKTLYMSGGQMGCPIVFRGPNGAAARVAAQHSQNFSSWYASVPGLKVVSPYSAADAKGLLLASIFDPDPVVFLENEILYNKNFDDALSGEPLPLGKADVMKKGKDVTIVSFSIGLEHVFNALPELSSLNIDAEIINLRTLRPMDTPTIIESIKKTNRLVVVEEGWPSCGIASEIIARVCQEAFMYLDAEPLRVTSEDVPQPYAANLEKLALPNPSKIVEAIKKVCYAH